MKKSLLLSLLCLIGLSSTQTILAAKEIYATLSDGGATLTLRYDDRKAQRSDVCTGWTFDYGTLQIPNDQKNAITKVVLDKSMEEARPISIAVWFAMLYNLTEIEHLDYLNTSELQSMLNVFYNDINLKSLDVSHFNTSKVSSMEGLFVGCESLTELDIRNFDMSHVKNIKSMFYNCSSLTTIYCNEDWSAMGNITSTDNVFNSCSALKGEKGTKYDSKHTGIEYARPDGGESSPGYFTSKEGDVVRKLYGVLGNDNSTLTLYYDNLYNSRGGNTEWSIDYYEQTKKVILDESMKDARPTTLETYFSDFSQLAEIEHLNYLNTSEVTNMSNLFFDCYALKSLDLSTFDTRKVESMASMFGACTALTEVNLSSFDVQNVKDMWGMFYECSSLTTIICPNDWSQQVPSDCDSEEMFSECTALVGEQKTAYDSENTDITYARPDDPENGKPGYFTLPESEQGITQTTNDQRLTTNKFINNGMLLIKRGEKTYNALGAELK